MKRLFLVVAVALVCSVATHAAPTACPTESLSAYLTSFGVGDSSCIAGGITYSDFAYTPSGGAPVAADITVTPNGALLAFVFNGSWTAAGTGSSDSTLQFSAQGSEIDDISAQVVAGSCTAPGSYSLSENVYAGLDSVTGSVLPGTGIGIVCTNSVVSATFTSPQSAVTVVKDLGVNGGGGNDQGSAIVSEFTDQLSTVPEPGSLLLFGTGILGVAGILRRKIAL
jgi:hypothetical protein